MTDLRFFVAPAEPGTVQALSAADPGNPFATPAFFESRKRTGLEGWVLGVHDADQRVRSGCGAFLSAGRLERKLHIPSLPVIDDTAGFWAGLQRFNRDHRITSLEIGSFGSPEGVSIPDLGPRCVRRSRSEFTLDLSGDPRSRLGSNHRRNLRKAESAGLTLARTRSDAAVGVHASLMAASMDRRRARGEGVGRPQLSPEHLAYMHTEAGELFQVVQEDLVLSSVLVLRAPAGAYYQSAGTSPDGMAVGASHLLMVSTAAQLSAEGARTFNLGGADEGSGLWRFKAGFGATPIPLVAASCSLAPRWLRLIQRGVTFLRR